MKGRQDCPRCQGQGLIFDPDPLKPALICACTAQVGPDAEALGLPPRYREAEFARFWKWWNNAQASTARALLNRVADLEDLLARPAAEVGEVEGREELSRLLQALKKRPEHGIRPAGAEGLASWALNGKHRFRHGWELWWVHGPAQTGRSTLAAAALRAWTERTGKAGRFVSVRTLSQAIKDAYYDVRSFQNQGFQSVRDLVEPLQTPALLVLDDFDRMDSDLRVAAALAQLLDHRYSAELPTILTAASAPEGLDQRENHPLARLDDVSLMERLRGAERVEMVPALKPWIDRLER